MTGVVLGAVLFALGLGWVFRATDVGGRLWGFGAMALASLILIATADTPGGIATAGVAALTIAPLLAVGAWLRRRLDHGRSQATSLDEQPR